MHQRYRSSRLFLLTNPIQVSSICATFAMAISGVWKIARRSLGSGLLNPSDESEVRRAGK
jgi:hypothetical protein